MAKIGQNMAKIGQFSGCYEGENWPKLVKTRPKCGSNRGQIVAKASLGQIVAQK